MLSRASDIGRKRKKQHKAVAFGEEEKEGRRSGGDGLGSGEEKDMEGDRPPPKR